MKRSIVGVRRKFEDWRGIRLCTVSLRVFWRIVGQIVTREFCNNCNFRKRGKLKFYLK